MVIKIPRLGILIASDYDSKNNHSKYLKCQFFLPVIVFTVTQGFIFPCHHSSSAHLGQNFLLFKGTQLRFKSLELLFTHSW